LLYCIVPERKRNAPDIIHMHYEFFFWGSYIKEKKQ